MSVSCSLVFTPHAIAVHLQNVPWNFSRLYMRFCGFIRNKSDQMEECLSEDGKVKGKKNT